MSIAEGSRLNHRQPSDPGHMTERQDDRLWGGRFERAPNEHFARFQRSFGFDRRLLPYEIAVDRAWAKALEPIGIFTAAEVKQTLSALEKISERAKTDSAWLEALGAGAEDVHHFVEKALVQELGALGWKLHTGRSRNELVATDFRLFVIDAAREIQHILEALLDAFLQQVKANLHVPMPGMTHMQHAQPILLSHFLLAHAEAFTRDIRRLEHAAASADACPMGSGALAGNSFAIDRPAIARELGFSRITANSLDAVSDRDFALDYLFALSGMATHLSRLAEDFVIFASQEFSYLVLPDEYSTGSSLMPQKKNPDCWELIRGKTGRITGALFGLLMTLKGLPNPALLATEAADYLVRQGIPFRQAHDIIGKVLREAEKQTVSWTALPLEALKKISPAFEADFRKGLSLEAALAAKKVPGGTAPENVRAAIADLEGRLNKRVTKTGAKP